MFRCRRMMPHALCLAFGMAAAPVLAVPALLRGGEAADGYPAAEVTEEVHRALITGQPAWLAERMPKAGEALPRNMILSEAQVKWLAARLPADAAAAKHLKFGYFRQALPGQWPHMDALAFLMDEQGKEPVGGERWLALGEAIAYGRAVTPPYTDWQTGYRALAEQAGALAQFPQRLTSVAIDYAMVAPPGIHRSTRAAVGEVRFFIENIFPRWLAMPDVSGTAEAIPDWAGLAKIYNAESLLWDLAAAEQERAEDASFPLRVARLALSKVAGRKGEMIPFAPERALPPLLALRGRDHFVNLPANRQAEALSLLGKAHQAAGDWDEALAALAAAVSMGGSRTAVARCAQAAWQATDKAGNHEAAERFRARLDAELLPLLDAQADSAEQLEAARLAVEIDDRRVEGVAALDRLLASEDAPAKIRRQAALSRLEGAAQAEDPEAGRRAAAALDSLDQQEPLAPLEALLAAAYRNQLKL